MFKRLKGSKGFVLPIIMMFLIVLLILIVALMYVSYQRFLISIHSVRNDHILISALNLAYYDLFTGRYRGTSGYNSTYYEQGWTGGPPFRATYKIPVSLNPGVIPHSCTPDTGNNCVAQGDFAQYMRVRADYDPSSSPQLKLTLLSTKEIDY